MEEVAVSLGLHFRNGQECELAFRNEARHHFDRRMDCELVTWFQPATFVGGRSIYATVARLDLCIQCGTT